MSKEPTKNGTYRSTKPESTTNGSTRLVTGRARGVIRWDECDAAEVLHFISTIAENGDAVTLTKTSDGGALSITVLTGRDRLKGYANGADVLLERLRDMLAELYD
jgi:uncharacterized protein YfaP (DUF2135 family)